MGEIEKDRKEKWKGKVITGAKRIGPATRAGVVRKVEYVNQSPTL